VSFGSVTPKGYSSLNNRPIANAVDILVNALRAETPLIGVFGQTVGWSEAKPDPVLQLGLSRAGKDGKSWAALIGSDQLESGIYEWLGERFVRRAPSEVLEQIGELSFSAVFTSSIDPGFSRNFATRGREPEAILLGDMGAYVTRNRKRPPIYYLFGRATAGPTDMQPPLSLKGLIQRRVRHAAPMLRNLTDLATGLGLIVVDGYDPNSDWLRAEDLLANLSAAPISGVIWCGAEPNLTGDAAELYNSFISSGIIVRDMRTLSHLLGEIRLNGFEFRTDRWDEPEVVTLSDGKRLITSAKLRLATQVSATILDDSWTAFLSPIPTDQLTSRFHAFHALSGGLHSLIDGVRRNFAIERDFEDDLYATVSRAVLQHSAQQGAIIVHGQSGVGKSIALARLAIKIREKNMAAVLFANGRLPQATDISKFLEEVDRVEGTTLIVIDAVENANQYESLLQQLRSRGHRIVVVGSSYKIEQISQRTGTRYVDAKASLSARERKALLTLSNRFAPESSQIVAAHAEQPNALARFYWDLPISRSRLSEGLGREARAVESALRVQGEQRRRVPAIGDFGIALVQAGYESITQPLLSSERGDFLDTDHVAAKIIDCVMVSSRLFRAVPVNLLIRAARMDSNEVEAVDLEVVRELFQGHDLFRWWYADAEGSELIVSARIQIEAELVCNRRLGGPVGEATRLLELIRCAYRAGPEDSEETRFLIDILRAVGPDGKFGTRYSQNYADIARALTELRTRHGVKNARLILQESALRRAYVKRSDVADSEKIALLDEASRAVEEALQSIAQRAPGRLHASRRTLDNLWVERAATYGFLATDSVRRRMPTSEIWSNYLAAREAVRRATGKVDTYYPLDIGLWLPAQCSPSAPIGQFE
jgi:hypothetical protein